MEQRRHRQPHRVLYARESWSPQYRRTERAPSKVMPSGVVSCADRRVVGRVVLVARLVDLMDMQRPRTAPYRPIIFSDRAAMPVALEDARTHRVPFVSGELVHKASSVILSNRTERKFMPATASVRKNDVRSQRE